MDNYVHGPNKEAGVMEQAGCNLAAASRLPVIDRLFNKRRGYNSASSRLTVP